MPIKPITALASEAHGLEFGRLKLVFVCSIMAIIGFMASCTSEETLKRNSDFSTTFQLTDKIMTEGFDYVERQEQVPDSGGFEDFADRLQYWMVLSVDAKRAIKLVNREYPGDPRLDSVNSLAPHTLKLHRSVVYIANTWLFSEISQVGAMNQYACAKIAESWTMCIDGGLDFSSLIPEMGRTIKETYKLLLEAQEGRIRYALVAWAPVENSSSDEIKTHACLEDLFVVSSELMDHSHYPSGSLLNYQTEVLSLAGKFNRTKERYELASAKLLR